MIRSRRRKGKSFTYRLKCDECLRQQATVRGGSGLQSDASLPEEDTLEVRGGSSGDQIRHNPDDVRCNRAAGKRHPHTIGDGERPRHLENPRCTTN